MHAQPRRRAALAASLALASCAPPEAPLSKMPPASEDAIRARDPSLGPTSCDLERLRRSLGSHRDAVRYAYCLVLGRDADPEGERGFTAALAARHLTRSGLLRALFESEERRARLPLEAAADSTFVDALYRMLLQREPDAGGRAYLLAALASGSLTREAAFDAVAASIEAFVKHSPLLIDTELPAVDPRGDRDPEQIVRSAYALFLGRESDPGGLAHYSSLIERNRISTSELLRALLDSPEHANRFAAYRASARAFVFLLYNTLLLRDPDPGAEGFVGALESGAIDPSGALASLLASSELGARHPVFRDLAARSCEPLRALSDGARDASSALRACIDATPAPGTLEIPPGTYRIERQVVLDKPLTLRTEGRRVWDPPCDHRGDPSCATLVASESFLAPVAQAPDPERPGQTRPVVYAPGILLVVSGADGTAWPTAIDHLVLDGNRERRAGSEAERACRVPGLVHGITMGVAGSSFRMTNSVSKNAVCNSALIFPAPAASPNRNMLIARSTFANNGRHDQDRLWADGLTINNFARSAVIDNVFIDNTDVDLIFGGCTDCDIQRNSVLHGDRFDRSSFAAVMFHAWPDASGANVTTGDFSGSDIADNRVDCGPMKRCGFGLLIGGDPWYQADTSGGSYHHNTIQNAQQGLLIDHARDLSIWANRVHASEGVFAASCGAREVSPYAISPDSVRVDRSLDDLPDSAYQRVSWDGCILSWWTHDY